MAWSATSGLRALSRTRRTTMREQADSCLRFRPPTDPASLPPGAPTARCAHGVGSRLAGLERLEWPAAAYAGDRRRRVGAGVQPRRLPPGDRDRRRADVQHQDLGLVREATRVERLAYTRTQAAEALGVSRSTFNRRVLPLVETVEMPWGTRLIPVDELERLIAERRRRPPRARAATRKRGRPRVLQPEVVDQIRAARAAGRTLRQMATDLSERGVPTAHGGAQWWPSTVRAALASATLRRTAGSASRRRTATARLAAWVVSGDEQRSGCRCVEERRHEKRRRETVTPGPGLWAM